MNICIYLHITRTNGIYSAGSSNTGYAIGSYYCDCVATVKEIGMYI